MEPPVKRCQFGSVILLRFCVMSSAVEDKRKKDIKPSVKGKDKDKLIKELKEKKRKDKEKKGDGENPARQFGKFFQKKPKKKVLESNIQSLSPILQTLILHIEARGQRM